MDSDRRVMHIAVTEHLHAAARAQKHVKNTCRDNNVKFTCCIVTGWNTRQNFVACAANDHDDRSNDQETKTLMTTDRRWLKKDKWTMRSLTCDIDSAFISHLKFLFTIGVSQHWCLAVFLYMKYGWRRVRWVLVLFIWSNYAPVNGGFYNFRYNFWSVTTPILIYIFVSVPLMLQILRKFSISFQEMPLVAERACVLTYLYIHIFYTSLESINARTRSHCNWISRFHP